MQKKELPETEGGTTGQVIGHNWMSRPAAAAPARPAKPIPSKTVGGRSGTPPPPPRAKAAAGSRAPPVLREAATRPASTLTLVLTLARTLPPTLTTDPDTNQVKGGGKTGAAVSAWFVHWQRCVSWPPTKPGAAGWPSAQRRHPARGAQPFARQAAARRHRRHRRHRHRHRHRRHRRHRHTGLQPSPATPSRAGRPGCAARSRPCAAPPPQSAPCTPG